MIISAWIPKHGVSAKNVLFVGFWSFFLTRFQKHCNFGYKLTIEKQQCKVKKYDNTKVTNMTM